MVSAGLGNAVRSTIAGVTLAALVAMSTAGAQRVRGTLTDSVTREVIPGAVVILLDSAARSLSRSIADTRGEYSVPRYLGTRMLRVMRIGFRARQISINATDSIVDVRLQPIPALVGGFQSVETRVCAGTVAST